MTKLSERKIEAALFKSEKPIEEKDLYNLLQAGDSLDNILQTLQNLYKNRGVELVKRGSAWCFITAPDLAESLVLETDVPRRLSRAAMETLAIIAYYQPITRLEIEEIRGVSLARTTLEALMDTGWIISSGHKPVPGRPTLWRTTNAFLLHFGLESLHDMPLRDEIVKQGLVSETDQGELFNYSTENNANKD